MESPVGDPVADALAASQERLALVLESAQLGCWDWNMVTGEVIVDDRWAQIIGYSAADVSPVTVETWRSLLHPQDLPAAEAAVAAHAAGNTAAYDVEFRMRHRTGRWVWVHSPGRIVERASDGTPLRMTGVHQDITALRMAAAQTRTSEARYRAVVEATASGLVVQAADGSIVECNPAAERMLGLTRDQMMGRTSVDPRWRSIHLDGRDFPGTEHPAMVTLATGQPQTGVFMGVHKPDGSLTWLRIDTTPFTRPEAPGQPAVIVSFTDVTAQVESDRARAASEARYRLLADTSVDVVVAADTAGVLTYLSPAVTDLLGYAPEDLLGSRIHTLVHPDDVATVAAVQQAVSDAGRSEFRARLRRADGSYRWVGAVGRDLMHEGRANGRVAAWRDIQAQVSAEQALTESQEQYQRLAENASDMVALADNDGIIRWISPSVTALGWSPEDVIGRPARELVHPDDLPQLAESRRAIAVGRSSVVELRYRTKDGDWRWFRVHLRPVTDDTGTVVGRVSGWQHIDTEREIREELRASEERYRLLAETMSDLVEEYDATWHLVWASPSVTGMLGFTPADMVGRHGRDLIHPDDDGPEVRAETLQAPVAHAASQRRRVRRLRADGSYVWVDASLSFRYDEAGNHVATYISSRDVDAQVAAVDALTASEERFRVLAESIGDVVIVHDVDGVVEWVSPSVRRVLGLDPAALTGTAMAALIHADDADDHRAHLTGQSDEHDAVLRARWLTASGATRWMDTRTTVRTDAEGTVTGGYSVVRDVDDQVRAVMDLQRSEQWFRTAMLSAPTGMAVVALDRTFTEVNPALCRILGRAAGWLVGRNVHDLLDDPDARIDQGMRTQVINGPDIAATREHQMIRSDGERIWVEHSVGVLRDPDGQPMSFVSQFVDVTEARHAREQLRFLASHDALTELMNRRELIARVEDLLARTPHVGINAAVLFVDVDNLKPINDIHGHAAGDTVIATVARRLRDSGRADDLVARLGGDEFVVVLTTIVGLDDAARIADKIHLRAAAPVRTDGGHDITVTLSIGLALVQPGDDSHTALHRADTALYLAKQQGRNRTVVHEPNAAGPRPGS